MPTGLTDKLLKVFRDILDETVCHGNNADLKATRFADFGLKAASNFQFWGVILSVQACFV